MKAIVTVVGQDRVGIIAALPVRKVLAFLWMDVS